VRSIYQPGWAANDEEKARLKAQANEILNIRGGNVKPFSPRDFQATAGADSVLLSWKLPTVFDDVKGFHVFQGTERNMIWSTEDRGVRQCRAALTAGATDSFFVCSVNALGKFSEKVQLIATANGAGEADLPPEFADEAAGGGDVSGGGVGRDRDVVDFEPRTRGTG
jgi:hypothetical protein